jgi:hypothetical protein
MRLTRRRPDPGGQRRSNRHCFGNRKLVGLRAMNLRNFGDQSKPPEQRPGFLVRGSAFEGVPVDGVAVGDQLEQLIEIL